MALPIATTADASHDPVARARRHAILRYAAGITAAFTLSEALGWFPSFLPPVLLATLLTSLPCAPPLKLGIVLAVVMAAVSTIAFALPSFLRGTPVVLFGAISLVVFLAFVATAQQRAKLPALLMLICIATIPIIVMVAPAQAGYLPVAMTRAMTVALLLLWLVYALWPAVVPKPAPPAVASIASPVRTALAGTAVVMPVMLVYLLFGLADALPVLVTTVLLVLNFDVARGAIQGLAMMLGNLIGGLVGMVAFLLLGIAPSLPMLALLTFLIGMMFALRIDKGGSGAAIAALTCNSSLIIFGSAIAAGPSNSGIWLTRLFQFAIACVFAIGMMSLVSWKDNQPNAIPPPPHD